jgi:hypothetical protein
MREERAVERSHDVNFENLKNVIAEKLETFGGELAEQSSSSQLKPILGDYGKQASEWLGQSAEYVRHFEPEKFNADVVGHIREKPGLSLLIAGAAGLIIGGMMRRL